MKSERPDLPLTIARLVRSATPVMLLDAPSVRLVRWTLTSAGLIVLSVVMLGVRADIAARIGNGWFVARAAATLATAAGAAILAFFMSVPGLEPSRRLRALPLAACLVWAVMLAGTFATTRLPLDLLLPVTPHFSCGLLIAATALPPGAALLRMLRQAAPLQATWTAGLAGLASSALGALGAQFVCPNDAAAHHLLWHFTPVVLLTLATAAAGPSMIGWPRRAS